MLDDKQYLALLKEQASITKNRTVIQIIMEFFKNNPDPTLDDVFKFIQETDLTDVIFNKICYQILSAFFSEGRAKDFSGAYDQEQLNMGIEVEKEHTTCSFMAERIAKDHLAEISDYYTRLKKMEEDAKAVDESMALQEPERSMEKDVEQDQLSPLLYT